MEHATTSSESFNVPAPPTHILTFASPFLALPREIRDIIYSLCFQRGDYRFKTLDHYFKICLCYDSQSARKQLPLWILTCKQILDEAMQQFYRDGAYAYMQDRYFAGLEGGLLTLQRCQKLRIGYRVYVNLWPGKKGREDMITMEIRNGGLKINPKIKILSRLHAFGFNERNVTIWFDHLRYTYIKTLLQDDRFPKNAFEIKGWQDPVNRVELVVEELCTDFSRLDDGTLRVYEIVYSMFQKRLFDLGVNMVASVKGQTWGYAVRDCVESEDHVFYRTSDDKKLDPQWGKKHHWHLEITRAAPGTTGKIVHFGLATFRNAEDQSIRFASRKESEDGAVEWTAPGLGTKRVELPQWLKDFIHGDVCMIERQPDLDSADI